MRYSRLIWNHTSADEPVQILSEHDEDGWERRKIELFKDGSIGYASQAEASGGTKLSSIQCPPDEEVNSEPEFRVQNITADEFEKAWTKARRGQAA